jgi:hypothetical protein
VGDLLVFRGDTIHRSSAVVSESVHKRLALAVHIKNGAKSIDLARVYAQSDWLLDFLNRNRCAMLVAASWFYRDLTYAKLQRFHLSAQRNSPLHKVAALIAYALEPWIRRRRSAKRPRE